MVEHIEQKVEQQSEYYGQTVAEVVILLEYKIIVPDICIIPGSSPKCHDAWTSKKEYQMINIGDILISLLPQRFTQDITYDNVTQNKVHTIQNEKCISGFF